MFNRMTLLTDKADWIVFCFVDVDRLSRVKKLKDLCDYSCIVLL
jgi:hypothetical protein